MIYQPELDTELTAEVFGELLALWCGEEVYTAGDTPTNLLCHSGLVETADYPWPGRDVFRFFLTQAGVQACDMLFSERPELPHPIYAVEEQP